MQARLTSLAAASIVATTAQGGVVTAIDRGHALDAMHADATPQAHAALTGGIDPTDTAWTAISLDSPLVFTRGARSWVRDGEPMLLALSMSFEAARAPSSVLSAPELRVD